MDKTYYETNSLPVAATLVSLGYPLDSTLKNPDGKFTFVFSRSDKFDDVLEAFWKRSLRVEPNSFWEAERFLKSRIYGS